MTRELPIVDAHHHVWDLSLRKHPWLDGRVRAVHRYGDYSAICRDYAIADYRRDTAAFDLRASVYVEAEWDPADPIGETKWVHEVAAAEGLPNAVVAQAWLDRGDVSEVLAKQTSFPLVRSVRHKPRSSASPGEARRGEPGSMDCSRWRDGFAMLERHGLHFDLQTPWWHFEAAAELARDFPRTTIIVDHAGLPVDRSVEGLATWRRALELVAREPNVVLKISGIGVAGRRWTAELQAPVVRECIAIFGARRAMFASNIPPDSLCGTFEEIFGSFFAITAGLPEADRRALFHDTAMKVYRPMVAGSRPT